MHLSRILDQIKRHPSPTEALTKLGKAMDKHEDNLLEKGFRILSRMLLLQDLTICLAKTLQDSTSLALRSMHRHK